MIEPVAESDLDEIRELIAAALRASVAGSDEDFRFLMEDIGHSLDSWRADPGEALHLKYTDGASIAGVALVKNAWNLTNLFVHPSWYGRGVATSLLREAVRRCRPVSPRHGFRVNSSTFAVPFYERFGFRRAGDPVDRPGGCVPMAYEF